jgi:hypothetical protein
MTWIKFALWLCGIYFTYYAAMIFWDIIRSGFSSTVSETHELSFAEHFEPIRPGAEYIKEYPASAVVDSGGVSLKQLFSLAREEAVEYTRAVSF